MNAHGITRTGLAHVAGKHLSAAPNDPLFSEEQLIEADRARNENKAHRYNARDWREAERIEQQQRDVADVIGRTV